MTNDTASAADRVVIVRESARENIWFLGDLIQPIVTSEMTQGRFQVALTHSKPGSEPPLHRHANEDEIFYILEGRMSFWAGDVSADLGPGDCILMPRDVPHIFRADSETGARWLVMTAPADFEHFLRTVAIPADYAAPQKGWEMTDEIEERLEKACDRFGITLLAPPGTRPTAI